MVEISQLEDDYEYTIEFDDGTEFVHLYFANVIDFDSPAVVRFDPLFEFGKDIERKVSGENVIIPYGRIIRVIKRMPD